MILACEAGISDNPDDKDNLNDLCSGLFTTSFLLGNILGPIIGNAGYVQWGAEDISEYVGYLMILYGIIYFICTYKDPI